MAEQKPPLLAVVGPTAGGKSDLALALAKALGGEIVACDSMQVYRGMDIGTAKPGAAEQAAVPHHLIDIADPCVPFTCADYVQAAKAAIAGIHARGRLPILCGGTGLYLERLLWGGTEREETAPDPALRRRWMDYHAVHGAHALHRRLCEVDPESAQAIHENNIPRVIRALEIYDATGIPKSEWDRRTRLAEPDYAAFVIGLRYADRQTLYARIAARVDRMLAAGLPDEALRLRQAGVFEANATAAQAIGYKELLPYLNGTDDYASAVARLKQSTRRYAKRQMTWFSAKDYVHWIPMDAGENAAFAAALHAIEAAMPWGCLQGNASWENF